MNKYIKQIICLTLIPAVLNLLSGCNFFIAKTVMDPSPEVAAKKIWLCMNKNDYFIIHHGNSKSHLKQMNINDSLQTITGVFEGVSPEHSKFLNILSEVNRMKARKGDRVALKEVHLFIRDYQENENGTVTIPLKSIGRLDIYDPATGRNIAYGVLTVVAIIGVAVGVLVIAFVASGASCPYVYTRKEDHLTLKGELLSGRNYLSLEEDYDLQIGKGSDFDKGVDLRISNELVENDYLNKIEVISVYHPFRTKIIPDESGKFHTVSSELEPFSAISALGINVLGKIEKADSSYFLFNEYLENDTAKNEITLRFKNPEQHKKGKLVLVTKNSIWLDYIWREFSKLFGGTFESWIKKQGKIPTKEHLEYCVQEGISLNVQTLNEQKWEHQGFFQTCGTISSKEMIMPLEIPASTNGEFSIKLSGAFNLWEIDHVYIDYSEDQPILIKNQKLQSAIDDEGCDVLSALITTDNNRFAMKETGKYVDLKFSPVDQGKEETTVFIRANGYYTLKNSKTGFPQTSKLKEFKKIGEMNRFSRLKMAELEKKIL